MIYIKEKYKFITTVQRSDFIALLFPLNDLNEANIILDNLRKEYPKANHYCYAYIFDNYMKYSDDGEPSNTAGKPILGVLQSKQLNCVLGVVIRYFGGIKLGAGNLLRTYVTSINNCFDNVEFYEKKELNLIKLSIDYKYGDTLFYLLEKNNYIIKERLFEEKIIVTVAKENFLENEIKASFNGNIEIENIGNEFMFVKK